MVKRTIIMGLLCAGSVFAGPVDRDKLSLNGLWDFYPDGGTNRHDIRVPSFWDAPQDYDYPMEWLHMRHGIYRKDVTIPNSMQGKQIFLEIRRVSVIAKVFVNGQHVGGETSGGYLMLQLPYLIDITAAARVGQVNRIEVRVWGGKSMVHGQDSQDDLLKERDFPADAMDEGRLLYPWCVDHWDGRRGINGDVYLVATPKCYVSDVFVMPDLHKNSDPADDEITLHVTVTNQDSRSRTFRLLNRAVHTGGQLVKTFTPKKVTLPARSELLVIINNVPWSDALYWWPHSPQLYQLHTELVEGNQVVDKLQTRFGFRQFYVRGNTFELNGIRANLRGDAYEFSWHEGYRHGPSTSPVLSTKELSPIMQRRLLDEYQKLNLNVLRPHKASGIDELYDWCDEIGMMVMDEAPFWQTHWRTDERSKANFEDWVRRMVKARRNHPSLIMWVAANECYRGPIPKYTVQAAKAMDPTRPVFHDDGIKRDNAPGDVANYHYTGGYPMGALFKDDIYTIYKNHDDMPTGEGEALFADGWPLMQADGTYHPEKKRSQRGGFGNADVISQAQWVRQVCRMVRAMRYVELADIRLYADWMFCFDPIAADLHPQWSDLSAPGIKPLALHRPLCNVFSDRYPEVIYDGGRTYYQNSHAPVAVFDKQWDNEYRIGAPFVVYKPGQRLDRDLVMYNDEFSEGQNLEVTYELKVTRPQSVYHASSSNRLVLDVPYGQKRQRRVTIQVPPDVTGSCWLDWILSVRKNGRQRFREINRIGVVNGEPAPQLSLVRARYDLGPIAAEQVDHWHKLKLVNLGGGQSLKWTAGGADETIQLSFRQGNLRREQELHFRVNTAGLEKGRRYQRRLVFNGETGGSATAHISFNVQ